MISRLVELERQKNYNLKGSTIAGEVPKPLAGRQSICRAGGTSTAYNKHGAVTFILAGVRL
jgi:hypothetical protein